MGFFSPTKSKSNTNPKIQNQTQHTHNTNTTCSKIQEHKPMDLLSFNKTNPNLTLNPFKEHKSTSSETQQNKLKNTNSFKRKHNISNTIAQIQA